MIVLSRGSHRMPSPVKHRPRPHHRRFFPNRYLVAAATRRCCRAGPSALAWGRRDDLPGDRLPNQESGLAPVTRRRHSGYGVTPRSGCDRGGKAEMKPQDYSTRTTYRPPAAWYQRLNWLGVLLTSLGLAPRDAVTLQVRGRTSGKARRIPILRTPLPGQRLPGGAGRRITMGSQRPSSPRTCGHPAPANVTGAPPGTRPSR